MKKRNRLLALLLAAMLLLSLCACGTAATTQQEAPAAAEAEAVTVPEAAASEDSAVAPQEAPETAEASEIPEDFLSLEPYIPENFEKAVIGWDDRVEVSPKTYPFSCIAYMVVEAECGCTWTGSGFMVSRYGFVTAAHCLYCSEHNKTIKNADYYFGYRSPKDCVYHFNAGGCTWWRGTSTPGTNDNDYGYILFSEPVGDTTGWLGMRALSDKEANNEEFYAAGYRNGVIKASMGEMTAYSDKIFKHYMDTEGGYSGCPVYDVDCKAVGINVAHHGNEYNIARRITSDLIEQMRKNGLFKK